VDAVRASTLPPFFHKTILIVPVLIVIAIFVIKKISQPKIDTKVIGFLNILFLVLVVTEIILFSFYRKSNSNSYSAVLSEKLTPIVSNNSPDIYFIILDGYAGLTQCKKGLQFDNQEFYNKLSELGFHNFDSTQSNYNYTPYSTASTLNMQYLHLPKNTNRGNGNKYALQEINKNTVTNFFAKNNYSIYNYSIFNVGNKPSKTASSFLTSDVELLISYTLIARLEKEILLPLAQKMNFKWYLHKAYFADKKNNETLIELTEKKASHKESNPKFVYTHLMMPHHPYYYDSAGKIKSLSELISTGLNDKAAYVSYLKYTNTIVYNFIKKIQQNSPKPPLIVLCSDHGYRYDKANGTDMQFSNIVSVLTPNKNYFLYPRKISNVNLFRSILNIEFNQKLPLLSDSTFHIEF
jgi:hypothetical protein